MKPIRSIAIQGAGAMGAAYAAMFRDAGGFDVSFVASGARGDCLRQNGLTVNGRHYQAPVMSAQASPEPVDLVLVALKHHHLPSALPDLAPLVGPDTTILSVMNGLESEDIIGAVYGIDKLVYAVAVGIDAVREGDIFTYANPGRIIFGPTSRTAPGRLEALREALTRARIPNEIPADIRRSLWWKFMVNVGINQSSAVLRGPYGLFQTSPDAMALMKMLMAEVVALAAACGIDLKTGDMEAWCAVMSGLSPEGKTSMLQDVEARRKTEVEIFAGKVVALGEQHRVPTPVNAAVYRIIKALESRYLNHADSA